MSRRCPVPSRVLVTTDGGGIRTRGKFNLVLWTFLFAIVVYRELSLLTRYMCKDRQKGPGDEVNLPCVRTPLTSSSFGNPRQIYIASGNYVCVCVGGGGGPEPLGQVI